MNRNRYLSHARILEKAKTALPLSRPEMVRLLQSSAGPKSEALFKTARELRHRYFGMRLFVYGFIYTSNYCCNNCNFCFYRKDNVKVTRYRKARSDIMDIAARLAESGVHLIDLTMGESTLGHAQESNYIAELCDTISGVKQRTDLPVMISPGVVSEPALHQLARAGADWYACYQETHTPSLFSRLRPGQDFAKRFAIKKEAKRIGMLIEEGILCNAGETLEDIAGSLLTVKDLGADQSRAMGFVPQGGTPMESGDRPGSQRELFVIAVTRLLFPDILIPASLDVEGSRGLEKRLTAGANVITSIIPSGRGLSGVAQNSLDIEDEKRTVDHVRKKIAALGGYEIASHNDYSTFINLRKQSYFFNPADRCRKPRDAESIQRHAQRCFSSLSDGRPGRYGMA